MSEHNRMILKPSLRFGRSGKRGRWLRILGFHLARLILILTGNLEVAACLRTLPTIASLPLRLRVEGDAARLEYPAGPEEWAQWQRHPVQGSVERPQEQQ